MISRLRGTVLEVTDDHLVLDVGGVGYEVAMPRTEIQGAPGPGEKLEVYTHTHFNKASGTRIYGFMTPAALRMFRAVIGASGIGARAGLSLLSVMTAEELAGAIVEGDVKRLAMAQGVSRKGAERLSLELRDKLRDEAAAVQGRVKDAAYDDALAALVALGYPSSLARRALAEGGPAKGRKTEELVKAALGRLSK